MTRRVVLTAVLAGLFVLGTAASGGLVSSGAAASTDESASFADRSLEITRGDTLEVTVRHSSTAHLYLGSEKSGFLLEVVLPGSGTDTISLDTYGSTGNPRSYVSGGGNVTLHTHELTRPLAASTYLMNVTVDGVERDIGQFVVHERGPMNATTRVAPGALLSTDSEVNADTVLKAASNRTTVARGDLAVLRLRETGLENAFKSEKLSGGTASNGIEVRFTERDPPQNKAPISFTPAARDVRVFPDFERDQIVFVWDTTHARLPANSHNHTYNVTITLNGEKNALVTEDVVAARTQVNLIPARVDIRAVDGFTVPPWENRTVGITGATSLAPGTTLDIRARSASRTNPFLQSHVVTVDENGTFDAAFDFAAVERGTEFPLWVRGHREQTEHTVALQAEQATLNFTDQELADGQVIVRNVSLAAGGFVGVTDGEDVLSTSPYLEPGRHGNVTVTLTDPPNQSVTLTAVAFTDRDGSRAFESDVDRPYAVNEPDSNARDRDTDDTGENSTIGNTADGAQTNTTEVTDSVTDTAVVWVEEPPNQRADGPTATPQFTSIQPSTETTTLDVRRETPIEPVVATGTPFNPMLAVFALIAAGVLARRIRSEP